MAHSPLTAHMQPSGFPLNGGRASASSSGPLLDSLSAQPLFASWLGGRLRTGQTNVLRVRRSSDNTEQDVGLVGDLVDLASLATFCGVGVGYLVKVYNAVSNAFTDMPAPGTAEQAIVYSFAPLGEIADGVTHVTGPVLGANGYLAAYFDGGISDPDPDIGVETGDDVYYRSDALGLTGDANITLACDVHTKDLAWQILTPMAIGKHLTIEDDIRSQFNTFIELDPTLDSLDYQLLFWPETTAPFTFDDYLNTFTDYPLVGWLQSTHAVAGPKFTLRINGMVQAATSSTSGGNLNMTAPRFVSWGGYPRYAAYDFSDTIPGISSAFFAWNAVLGASDQAALDAWQLARHA